MIAELMRAFYAQWCIQTMSFHSNRRPEQPVDLKTTSANLQLQQTVIRLQKRNGLSLDLRDVSATAAVMLATLKQNLRL
jgi:hypothetical protein